MKHFTESSCDVSEKPKANTPKYSQGRDYSLGASNKKGHSNRNDESSFSQSDKLNTGLNLRKPL